MHSFPRVQACAARHSARLSAPRSGQQRARSMWEAGEFFPPPCSPPARGPHKTKRARRAGPPEPVPDAAAAAAPLSVLVAAAPRQGPFPTPARCPAVVPSPMHAPEQRKRTQKHACMPAALGGGARRAVFRLLRAARCHAIPTHHIPTYAQQGLFSRAPLGIRISGWLRPHQAAPTHTAARTAARRFSAAASAHAAVPEHSRARVTPAHMRAQPRRARCGAPRALD